MVTMVTCMIKHGSRDKAEIQGWKWKQGFEIIKKNMKKVAISTNHECRAVKK